jgi:hypothetical protein
MMAAVHNEGSGAPTLASGTGNAQMACKSTCRSRDVSPMARCLGIVSGAIRMTSAALSLDTPPSSGSRHLPLDGFRSGKPTQ